jgi:STE24 endopeptidase
VRKLFLGLLAGVSAGYVVVRTAQALAPRVQRVRSANDPKAYGRTRRALALAGTLRSTAASLAFAYGPLAPRIARALVPLPRWARPAVYLALLTLASSIAELGVGYVEDYGVERRYGLTDQSPRGYLADAAKSTALATLVVAGIGLLGGLAVRRFRRTWPIVAALGTLPLLVLANFVVPVYVLPLFNRFEPVRGDLERRLRALAARFGARNAEILRMDMSKQTKKANAFVVGVGGTHRIVLGDTLIDAFEPEEIEFVIAHELGHYVTRDTWRMIAVAEGTSALLFALTAYGMREDGSDDSLFLLRIAAWLGAGALVLRPALSAFSRSREWAADDFALATTRNPQSGAAAFRRLRDQNLAEEEPPAWHEFLFASHPSLGKRIAALESA